VRSAAPTSTQALSALSFGPAKGGLKPWLVVFLILFGTGIVSALLVLFL
jgi:hypothetical protein